MASDLAARAAAFVNTRRFTDRLPVLEIRAPDGTRHVLRVGEDSPQMRGELLHWFRTLLKRYASQMADPSAIDTVWTNALYLIFRERQDTMVYLPPRDDLVAPRGA